jgi:hydrogenase nickel incorporation protein HypA/HybF
MPMHEGPLVRGLIDAAAAAVERHGGGEVTNVTIVVGDLTGIDDDSVRAHFEVMSEGTAVYGAPVTIVRAPASVTCWDCAGSFEAVSGDPRECPSCGSNRVRVAPGPQPYVDSVDVEEGGRACA